MAFCDGYQPGMQVNHKDGNKQNNSADNLEWVTRLENVSHSINVLGHHHREGQNPASKSIFGYDKNTGDLVYKFPSIMSAARYFSPDNEKRARHIQNVICLAANGKNGKKSYRGYVWRYE